MSATAFERMRREAKKKTEEQSDNLDNLSYAELVDIAKEKGVKYSSVKKEDLKSALAK